MAGNVSSSGKQRWRVELEARRRALSPQDVQAKSGEVETHLAALSFFKDARRIALYAAQPFEVQTKGLFALAGPRAVFPRVVGKGQPLALHAVASAAELVAGTLGLLEPRAGAPALAPHEIDLWIIPGVGFTRGGERLGRGAGYYDRTLALARPGAPRVGICFACCLVDALPTESWDARMDWVVTEREALRCQRVGE